MKSELELQHNGELVVDEIDGNNWYTNNYIFCESYRIDAFTYPRPTNFNVGAYSYPDEICLRLFGRDEHIINYIQYSAYFSHFLNLY